MHVGNLLMGRRGGLAPCYICIDLAGGIPEL